MASGNPKARGGREPEPGLSHPCYRGVRLTAADAEAGWRLSTEADWNQTDADWRFLLAAGNGFGFEDRLGTLVASAVLLPYGEQVAWVGMVLVTAAARRQGLATQLVEQAMRLARARRLPLLLDATDAGQAVYRPLGFREVGRVTRWRAEAPTAQAPLLAVEPIGTAADLERWAKWDAAGFGADRSVLLQALRASRPDLARQVSGKTGEGTGYCLGRSGRTATQIGPVVAGTDAAARALLSAALAHTRGPVLVDAREGQAGFERELVVGGFRPERSFVRMAVDLTGGFGRPDYGYATAGPEFG